LHQSCQEYAFRAISSALKKHSAVPESLPSLPEIFATAPVGASCRRESTKWRRGLIGLSRYDDLVEWRIRFMHRACCLLLPAHICASTSATGIEAFHQRLQNAEIFKSLIMYLPVGSNAQHRTRAPMRVVVNGQGRFAGRAMPNRCKTALRKTAKRDELMASSKAPRVMMSSDESLSDPGSSRRRRLRQSSLFWKSPPAPRRVWYQACPFNGACHSVLPWCCRIEPALGR